MLPNWSASVLPWNRSRSGRGTRQGICAHPSHTTLPEDGRRRNASTYVDSAHPPIGHGHHKGTLLAYGLRPTAPRRHPPPAMLPVPPCPRDRQGRDLGLEAPRRRARAQAHGVDRIWLHYVPAPAPLLSHRLIFFLVSGIPSISLARIHGPFADHPVACLAESHLAGLCVVAGVNVSTRYFILFVINRLISC